MSIYKSLGPEEIFLEGRWVLSGGHVAADEVSNRIEYLTSKVLLRIATDSSGWSSLYKDPADGRFWELYYSESSSHGGGPPALKWLAYEDVRVRYPGV